MSVTFDFIETDEIIFDCPHCGHRLVPPEDEHCEHTVFVYVDPAGGDAGFAFVNELFADNYLQALDNAEPEEDQDDDEFEISDRARFQFVKADLPPFHEQEIQLNVDVLRAGFSDRDMRVIELVEVGNYYPCRVTVGVEKSQALG